MRLLLATAVIATVAAGAFVLLEQQGPSSEEACDQLALVQHLDDTLATLDPLSIASASIQLESDVTPSHGSPRAARTRVSSTAQAMCCIGNSASPW